MTSQMQPDEHHTPELKRSIGLVQLVFYGLGVTIGAGIYVLIGEATAKAGIYAPSSFLLAACILAFSAGSFAEFSGRIPLSAGEAVYVEAGFGKSWLVTAVGGGMIISAIVAGAAISLGCAGYVAQLIDWPQPIIITLIIGLMGLLAAWGIKESITFAAVLTLMEVLGLVVIIYAGFINNPNLLARIPEVIPPFTDGVAISGVFAASLIAFFAFIGFDDMVNIVEETYNPKKTMPLAIGITLVVVVILYFFIALVAIDAVPVTELAATKAPVGLLFERLTGFPPLGITIIAIAATMNGVVIQIIMASRVIYGLGKKSYLPKLLAEVNSVTRTPVNATIAITLLILILALLIPLEQLAEWTSQIILSVFLLVNLSLVRVKWRGDPAPKGIVIVPIIIPILGALTCLMLILVPLFTRL